MAALLKKRALAEYCQTITEEGPRPAKRLQIIRRSKVAELWDFNLASLNSTNDAKDLLESLVSLQQALPAPTEVISEIMKSMMDLLANLSDGGSGKTQLNSIIIIKILTITSILAPKINAQQQEILDKVIACTNRSKSKKIVAHGINTAHLLVKHSGKCREQVIQLALDHLGSNNYLLKVRCLEALGGLWQSNGSKTEEIIIKSLVAHAKEQDNRVRSATFKSLLDLSSRGLNLPSNLYDNVCQALTDDYQSVREAALSLITALAEQDPEGHVHVNGNLDHRLARVDHAFTQICNAVNDGSVRVRTQAVSLLGTLRGVSDIFLQQTLDKKLMSNMRRKCSAHERAREVAASGEFSSGRKWSEDIPMEAIAADAASIIDSGACGAFVHGLEDEFLEVRTATLEAICSLAGSNRQFANQCLDFLVDMFNDEIEEVRLKAIQVLQKIAPQIKLRPDQLDEILHALKDSWLDIRESLHSMLATCKVCTTSCMTATVEGLLDNARRYPNDKRSIHRCLKQVGTNQPELVLALVPQLLVIHPYFDGVEPSVQDGEYICKLILVLNAAAHCPTILPLLEQHTLRHYSYLRDTMPQLVPQLNFNEDLLLDHDTVKSTTLTFLRESLEKTRLPVQASACLRLTIYDTVKTDLIKLASIEPQLTSASKLASLYINCMLVFTKIFSSHDWITPSSLSSQQSGALTTSVEQLLKNSLRLRYAFGRLTPAEEASVRSLRVRTLALQLVYVVRGSTGSALGLCDSFLEHTEALDKYLNENNLVADSFIEAVVKELSLLEETPRPGAVARILQPLLLAHPIPSLEPFDHPRKIQMCEAEILEPSPDNESLYKLSAGLIVGVPLNAEIWHLDELQYLRIRVTQPDHSSYLLVPNRGHLKLVSEGCHRLLTTVLISAQVWSEACQVGISLVLDLSDQESTKGRKHTHTKTDDSSTIVPLCTQAKVLVWPKQIRRGV